MSRTALDGFVIEDVEKDYLLSLIKKISSAYFVEVYGFSILGNHFHLLVQMNPGSDYSDEEIRRRHKLYYGEKGKLELTEGQIPYFRERWSDLSEYVKCILLIAVLLDQWLLCPTPTVYLRIILNAGMISSQGQFKDWTGSILLNGCQKNFNPAVCFRL